jgi:hypothetical protein
VVVASSGRGLRRREEEFGGEWTSLTGIKGVGAKIYGADPLELDTSAATYENAGAKEGGATMRCLGANDDGAEQKVYFLK